MAASQPLQGSELIDCARANASFGTAVACERCGYGQDESQFLAALKRAGAHIGVEITGLGDLMADPVRLRPEHGIEIAPDTPSRL